MKAAELKAIAASLVQANAPGLPTVVLAREVPLYEVDFAALAFDEEEKLPSIDWAALALARALGTISPHDVDSYLGLGAAVSEGLVYRLLEEGLFEERTGEKAIEWSHVPESDSEGFFARLFRTKRAAENVAAPSIARTLAKTVHESRARAVPACHLSSSGVRALERGAVARHRVRPARLLFVAQPLLFLEAIDEKRHRHTQHRRPSPLEPDWVPQTLRSLDAVFGLPPHERLLACGIENSIRGFAGQFIGLMPGAQWEVRQTERRTGSGREPEAALLVFAAFPSTDSRELHWRAYLRRQEQTLDCSHIDAARFLHQDLLAIPTLLASLKAEIQAPEADALREDGAFEIRCEGPLLTELLGESDCPDDTFLPAVTSGWGVGLRTHAMPVDRAAGRIAFFDFLRRRDAALRRDFDRTCADVATSLSRYWGDDSGLPSADEAAVALWARAQLRAALCMRRRHQDLVAPYEPTEATQ